MKRERVVSNNHRELRKEKHEYKETRELTPSCGLYPCHTAKHNFKYINKLPYMRLI